MSATTAGAVKAYLEGKAFGIPWFRDRAPESQALPFGVIQEALDLTLDKDGDAGGVAELVQVSLFQEWRKADGKPGERYGLRDDVIRALHNARLATAPTVVYGVLVRGAVRLPGVDAPGAGDSADAANVVHDAITISIRRNL